MKKALIIAYGFVFIFLSAGLKGQDISITMDVPENVTAGADFEVRLTLNKGTISDYSRFSQELPYGLTASNVSSPNADFSFEEQRVRIIWLKLPDDPVIHIVYKVRVDRRLKGTFTLAGNFAHVVNDERKYLDVPPSGQILITPDPTVDMAMLVDIKDFESVVMGGADIVVEENFAMAIRQKPVQMSDGSVFVHLLIRNPEGSKYIKIEETIPTGYMFEEVDSHRGIVSFGSSQVKYIWMKRPEESEFRVSYKLVPRRGERQEAMHITGVISYAIGSESFEDPVMEIEANLSELSEEEIRELLASGNLPGGVSAASASGEQSGQQRTDPGQVSTDEPGVIMGTRVLAPDRGVYYRIQLIALAKPFNGELHFSRLGINREIRVEQEAGMYKYTAGSFGKYVEASSYKKKVTGLPGLEQAFIVAYRNGSRISIEEAFRYSD